SGNGSSSISVISSPMSPIIGGHTRTTYSATGGAAFRSARRRVFAAFGERSTHGPLPYSRNATPAAATGKAGPVPHQCRGHGHRHGLVPQRQLQGSDQAGQGDQPQLLPRPA